MNPAVVLVIAWVILVVLAWAFVHGAAKLRQQEDAMRAEAAPPVIDLPAQNATDSGRLAA